jgi:hypothetical protein
MPGGRSAAANPRGGGAELPAAPTSPAEDPRAHLVWLLRDQARACEAMGSPLYADLLRAAAADAAAAGICWRLLGPHVAPGRASALALRFLAAVHRLVLTDRAPRLAPHYPSVGGTRARQGAWEALRATLGERAADVAALLALPCQTNEVGRAAALAVGFLHVALETGLPLRCLEVGASAGLNLRWDRFHYGGAGLSWGEPASPVDLTGFWREPLPLTVEHAGACVRVTERQGCDEHPVDPTSADGALALTAAVWADQTDRLQRLRGALALAAEVPARVDRATLDTWTAARLAEPAGGVATVVFHSVVDEYLTRATRLRFHGALAAAGARATTAEPLAWLRLEPRSALRAHGLALTLWPGGATRALALCGAHGTDVRALPSSA